MSLIVLCLYENLHTKLFICETMFNIRWNNPVTRLIDGIGELLRLNISRKERTENTKQRTLTVSQRQEKTE